MHIKKIASYIAIMTTIDMIHLFSLYKISLVELAIVITYEILIFNII